MKIAILSPSVDVKNGYGNFTFEYCNHLTQQNDIEFILYLPKGEEISQPPSGYPIQFELQPRFLLSQNPIRLASYTFHRLSIPQVDLIHTLFAFPFALTAMGNARRLGVPYIVGTQGTYSILPLHYWPTVLYMKAVYNRAAQIISPSQYTAEKIRQFSGTSTPITVIHNSIHFDRFQQEMDLSELEARYRPGPIILSVGGLKRRKGQDNVLQAFKIVHDQFPQAKYICVGRGNWQPYLENLASDLNIADSVFFLTDVGYEDLVKYFQICDIYIHLPRNVHWHYEGFGLVYLEAGACGKPVVGTFSGGVPDSVIDGKTGLLVPEDDPQSAAEAVLKILKDPLTARKLGENGRVYAQQHSWSQMTQAFIQVYRETLG